MGMKPVSFVVVSCSYVVVYVTLSWQCMDFRSCCTDCWLVGFFDRDVLTFGGHSRDGEYGRIDAHDFVLDAEKRTVVSKGGLEMAEHIKDDLP